VPEGATLDLAQGRPHLATHAVQRGHVALVAKPARLIYVTLALRGALQLFIKVGHLVVQIEATHPPADHLASHTLPPIFPLDPLVPRNLARPLGDGNADRCCRSDLTAPPTCFHAMAGTGRLYWWRPNIRMSLGKAPSP
jgi:hypothetical protein